MSICEVRIKMIMDVKLVSEIDIYLQKKFDADPIILGYCIDVCEVYNIPKTAEQVIQEEYEKEKEVDKIRDERTKKVMAGYERKSWPGKKEDDAV